eukprot:TRINITY_DN5928_c0_g1::TRINITY_DN5928_c0_g1_i1::g.9858::m.9858 TRINITY_DN5928_c0_g1::TRINITY_DN5928_c0_g1_i1::g.9858  ORF type:complete len:309 (-),score=65.60,PapC_C/PF13953.1/1.7e+02,PapC_C/PF13953.1/15,PapC_C/PF13953.1/48 TRINITY_DN5928_c0_g1_i1:213-1037(-)
MSLTVFNKESNSADIASSAVQTTSVLLTALSDAPTLTVQSQGRANEDTRARLTATPFAGLDTDGSERFKKLAIVSSAPAPINIISFSVVSSTHSVSDLNGYTMTAMGSGFAARSSVEGFSLQHLPQCDLDLTLSLVLYAVEENAKSSSHSSPASVAIQYDSVADTPSLTTTQVVGSKEDAKCALIATPAFGADTDCSDRLQVLVTRTSSTSLLASVRFSSLSRTSSQLNATQGLYTVQGSGTGFAPASKLLAWSVSPMSQCDVDFQLQLVLTGV